MAIRSLAKKCQTVTNGNQGQIHAGVVVNMVIECIGGLGVLIGLFRIDNAATPQGIVDQDQSAGGRINLSERSKYWPCSGAICVLLCGKSAVAARGSASTGSSRKETSSR